MKEEEPIPASAAEDLLRIKKDLKTRESEEPDPARGLTYRKENTTTIEEDKNGFGKREEEHR